MNVLEKSSFTIVFVTDCTILKINVGVGIQPNNLIRSKHFPTLLDVSKLIIDSYITIKYYSLTNTYFFTITKIRSVNLKALSLAALTLGLVGCASMTPTTETSSSYVVYDIQDSDLASDILADAVLRGIQSETSRVRATRGIPSYPLIEQPARFELKRPEVTGNLAALVGEMPQRPSCSGSVLTVNAVNSGMASQGENTMFFACVIPYAGGHTLSIYTTFEKTSGGFSAQALGASLARSVTGDSSQFIPKTIDAIMTQVDALNVTYEVLDQYPVPRVATES